jgi:putative SOS response-associated peptidase YedK
MQALKLHFQFIGTTWTEWEERQRGRNEPPQSAAVPLGETYPNYEAPVIVDQDGSPAVRSMRWGSPPPPFVKSKAPVTNVRNIDKGYWKAWLGRDHRCLVPASSFSEFDQVARKPRWFRRRDGVPFFFAGIWRPWTGDRGTKARLNVGDHLLFSFLTTGANAVVAPIHPKAMPVLLLDGRAARTWLRGTQQEALALQRPANHDDLELLPIEEQAA